MYASLKSMKYYCLKQRGVAYLFRSRTFLVYSKYSIKISASNFNKTSFFIKSFNARLSKIYVKYANIVNKKIIYNILNDTFL